MSTGSGKNKKTRKGWKWFLALVLVIVFAVFGLNESNPELWQELVQYVTGSEVTTTVTGDNNQTELIYPVSGTMQVHMIDVGQGDGILITQGEHAMLIDCGEPEYADEVIKYLNDLGIEHLDYVVGTHVHSDHIGAIAEVIRAFYDDDTKQIKIGKVYTPDDSNTTLYFEDFLQTVADTNLTWVFPKVGETIRLGDATVKFLAPNSEEYSNTNNYSIGLLVTFGETDVILTGDAEKKAEKEMIDTGLLKDVEVFKAGHHGSDTSNTQDFLEAIKPEYVMISAGLGNKHDHPIKSVMERFEEMGIVVYRTDESGNVVMTTDGKEITWNVKPGDYLSGVELVEESEKK